MLHAPNPQADAVISPKILTIPTRFDTEYIWTATQDSLTVSFDLFHRGSVSTNNSSDSYSTLTPKM